MSQSVPDTDSIAEDSGARNSVGTFSTGAFDSEYVEEEVAIRNPSIHQDSPTPWYRRRRNWAICLTINIILLIILLPLLFLVIIPEVAQSTINKSILVIDSLNMHLPMNETHFSLDTVGSISNGGGFKSRVSFPNGAVMVYKNNVIGEMSLPTIDISGGKGNISSSGLVHVPNSDLFAEFVKDQLNEKTLTFTLKASVTIKVLGITKSGLDLNKDVTIAGSNGFRDPGAVNITGFSVSNNPNDPSTLANVVTVSINNSSPVSVYLGTFGVNNVFENVTLGPSSAENLQLQFGLNTITMNGTVTQKTTDEIRALNDFLSKLTNGDPVDLISVGDYAKPDGVNEISWLTPGIRSLSLPATLQLNKSDIVRGVDFGNVTLKFTKETAYAPIMSTSGSKIAYKMPFDVTFDVEMVSQNLTLLFDDTPLATFNASWTNATNDPTTIYVNMPDGSLTVLDGQHELFESFLKNFTLSDVVPFAITGTSGVQAKTVIASVEMDGVSFSLPVQMKGLGGLSTPANITKFNVAGGTQDALLVEFEAALWNPSDSFMNMGDVNMTIAFQGVSLGDAFIPNFTLIPGSNTINATATFHPNDTPEGRFVLGAFLSRTSVVLTMSGFPGCSDVASLVPALEALNTSAILPGLTQNLVSSATLQVHNDTGNITTGTTIVFNNIFDTSVTISSIQANVTTGGLLLANINQDLSSQPLTLPANTNTTMPELSVQLSSDPSVMFTVLHKAAVAQNLDTKALDALLKLGNITVDGADPNVTPDPSLFANFNLKEFVTQALHQIVMTTQMMAVVRLGEYQTILPYSQDIIATTDESIALLIPGLGRPIVQAMVSVATTHFDKILLHDLSDASFNADISGVISNTGPFSATISFPNTLSVSSNGAVLGTMKMPDITAGNNAAQINTTVGFSVADAGALEKFSIQLLGTDSAQWDMSTDGVIVQTMGVPFDGIKLTQSVQLQGSNGFKGQVQVLNVQLPGIAPEGGIAMVLTVSLFNPGTVGIDPGSIQFNSFYKNVLVGPAASSDVILSNANNTLSLKGRVTPKTDPNEIAVISELFSSFLSGTDVELDTIGVGVVPASGSCTWLSQAVTHLAIQVILPAPKGLQLIPAVNIGNLDLAFTPDTAYAPLSSSTNVGAKLFNPFGFPLDIQQVSQNITVVNENADMVSMSIPQSPAQTDPGTGVVTTGFTNIPFAVISGQENNFNDFVKDLTIGKEKTFTLKGTVDTIANTPSGKFNINGIGYNVQTTLSGLQGLQSVPVTLSNMTVKGGTADFMDIAATVSMANPSNIKVSVGDVAFDVFVGDSLVGQTILNNLVLASGKNDIPAAFHYQPSPDVLVGAGADLLGAFLGNGSIGLTIKGNPKSTNITSLEPTFSQMAISSTLNGIGAQLILNATVTTKGTGPINATMVATLNNPLDVDLGVLKFFATTFLAGTREEVGILNVTLPFPLTIPAKKQLTAPAVPFTVTMDPKKLIPIIIADKFKLPVDLEITTTALVGKYNPVIHYSQFNLITTVVAT